MGNNNYLKMLKEEKRFCLVIIANIINRFGDSLDSIAYGWMVYSLTNSKSWLAVMIGVNMIPTVLFQPFSGALCEFFNKKKAVIYCDIGRGLIVFITAFLYMRGTINPYNLLVLTFMNSTLEAVRIPNGMSILPEILKKENLKSALAFNQGASRMAELIGLGLASFIIGTITVGGAICLDAITFIISGMIFILIKTEETEVEKKPFMISLYTQSMKTGCKYFFHNNISVMVCLLCVVLNITAIPITNLQIPYISEYLHLNLTAVSLGSMLTTIGAVIGSFLLPALTSRINEMSVLLWGGFIIGFIYFAFIIVGNVPVYYGKFGLYLLVAFLFGVINSSIDVALQVILVTHIPQELLGRIGGLFNSLACSSIPVGSFLFAGIGARLSIKSIYFLTGLCTLLSFWFIGRMKAINELI